MQWFLKRLAGSLLLPLRSVARSGLFYCAVSYFFFCVFWIVGLLALAKCAPTLWSVKICSSKCRYSVYCTLYSKHCTVRSPQNFMHFAVYSLLCTDHCQMCSGYCSVHNSKMSTSTLDPKQLMPSGPILVASGPSNTIQLLDTALTIVIISIAKSATNTIIIMATLKIIKRYQISTVTSSIWKLDCLSLGFYSKSSWRYLQAISLFHHHHHHQLSGMTAQNTPYLCSLRIQYIPRQLYLS